MHKQPAIKKALIFLSSSIQSGRFLTGQKLPGVRLLSQLAGVSKDSMTRAVKILKKQGVLTGMPGRPCCISTGGAVLPEIEILTNEDSKDIKKSGQLWQRIRNLIEKDIVGGKYKPGYSLPTLKEMQFHYKVNYKTLKKALTQLQKDGLLESAHKTYTPSRTSSVLPHARIGFIALCDRAGKLQLGSLGEPLLRMIEEECVRMDIALDIYTYNEFLSLHNIRSRKEGVIEDESVLGYIYVVPTDEGRRPEVLRTLTSQQKPISILDIVGGWKLPSYAHTPNIRLFSAAVSQTPGYQMGRYLYELGHRRIAYIAPFHGSTWSKNRQKGLQQWFSKFGSECRIYSIAYDNPPLIHTFLRRKAVNNALFIEYQKFYEQWIKKVPESYVKVFDPVMSIEVHDHLITKAEFGTHVLSLFKKAMGLKDVSAWVISDDYTALNALAFAQDNGINVPDDLSIVSFDDSLDALHNGLTSYNFNMQAIGHQMLKFVVNPRSFGHRQTRRPMEIEGIIISRATAVRHSS